MSPSSTSILTLLQAHVERDPERLLFAYLDGEGRVRESYGRAAFLQRTAGIAAHLLRTHPLPAGERVLLVYPPGLEAICAFFACVRLGLIPVPVYPPASHGFEAALYRMNYIAKDCGAVLALTDRSYHWTLRLQRLRTGRPAIAFGGDATSRIRWIPTNDVGNGTTEGVPERHSEILFLQYTSGSTLDPRGVMVTHRNVIENCEITIDHRPTGVSWLPQFHDMGLIGAYLFVGLKGGTTYGMSPLDFIRRPSLWLKAMGAVGATIGSAPNFAYGYCLRPDKVPDEELAKLDLSSIRVLMNGAEPVRPDVFEGFLRRFGAYGLRPGSFSSAYGLAETSANRSRYVG